MRKFERHVVEEIELTDTATMRAASRRERFADLRLTGAWIGLWLLLVAASLLARDAWSPDETRLLGIAWETWSRGNLLVAYLNGQAELHAPLFFWLVHLGWALGGVSEWWARLVPMLGALASLFVLQRLARRLWPDESEVSRYAPLLLLGTFAFALVAGVTLPDTWLLCFVLTTLWALLVLWRTRDHRVWLLAALGLSGALLAGGPIALVYVLPLALLAPLWARPPRPPWGHWYADLFKATAMALTVFGLWLVAVGLNEGWPQVVRLLSHSSTAIPLELLPALQPWWTYVALAPVVTLPWSVLPLAWMRLWHIRREPLDGGFVFCLLWLVLPLLLLSLLPLKYPMWLLPLVPAGVLMAARLLLGASLRTVHEDMGFAGMALPIMALGGTMMVLPRLPRVELLPDFLWNQSPLVGVAVMAVGIATAWLPIKDTRKRVFDIAALGVLLVVFAVLGIGSQFNAFHAVPDAVRALGEMQTRGNALAYVGEYRGELHFAARLREPIAVFDTVRDDGRDIGRIEAWAAAHPTGVLIVPGRGWQPRLHAGTKPLLDVSFRDGQLLAYEARYLAPTSSVAPP